MFMPWRKGSPEHPAVREGNGDAGQDQNGTGDGRCWGLTGQRQDGTDEMKLSRGEDMCR